MYAMRKACRCKKSVSVMGVCVVGIILMFLTDLLPYIPRGVTKIGSNPQVAAAGKTVLAPNAPQLTLQDGRQQEATQFEQFPLNNNQHNATNARKDANTSTTRKQQMSLNGNQPNVTIVLILAYMHTGSTFTGSIFQQHPGSFYEYEPLRALQQETRAGRGIQFMNGTHRSLNGTAIDVSIETDAVSNMITCNHGQLDTSTLSFSYFGNDINLNRDKRRYYACLGPRRKQYRLIRSEQLIKRCLHLLTGSCGHATLRVIKFIRFSMEAAGRILSRYPTVKLLHLLRDPRALMDSQVRKNDMGSRHPDRFIKNVQLMCSKMQLHLSLLPELKLRFPTRIFQFRYEDIADNPTEVSRSMFNFVNVSFSSKVQDYVRGETTNKHKTSSEISRFWRKHISSVNLEIVNRYCEPLYEQLEYIKYNSISDVRNLTKATYKKHT